MQNKPLILITSAVLVIVIAVTAVKLIGKSSTNTQTQNSSQATPSISTPASSPEQGAATNSSAPLPQPEDVIRTFFNLINEKKIPDAIGMLSPKTAGSESTKQTWGVQFNAFKKVTVKSVEPSLEYSYKVVLDVEMKPEAANAQPMPNFGWENGENIRWIGLEKVDNVWKIAGIATGP